MNRNELEISLKLQMCNYLAPWEFPSNLLSENSLQRRNNSMKLKLKACVIGHNRFSFVMPRLSSAFDIFPCQRNNVT